MPSIFDKKGLDFRYGGDVRKTLCQTIVCPVNTVGAMGSGLALYYKLSVPGLYPAYQDALRNKVFATDGLFLYKTTNKHILCFPTKKHWKDASTLELVESSLVAFKHSYKALGITSACFPRIGCGYGGLDWKPVKDLIIRHLGDIDIYIEVCC